jgi:hypothetical protein
MVLEKAADGVERPAWTPTMMAAAGASVFVSTVNSAPVICFRCDARSRAARVSAGVAEGSRMMLASDLAFSAMVAAASGNNESPQSRVIAQI